MNLADNIDIESLHMNTNDGTLFSVGKDVETLIRIIELTGHKEALICIFHSPGDGETLDDIIESTGDINTLIWSIESIEGCKDTRLLNTVRAFSQDELDAALIFCCQHGYTFLVQDLVNLGADVQIRDRNGSTPLLICAENGFTNMAKLLIQGQREINNSDNCGNTALILAIGRSNSVEMVKLLLAQVGINVNHQNKEGNTALMKAIEAMNVGVIKLLLDSQENTAEVLNKINNCRNETAQDLANNLGIGKIVKLLAEPECEPVMEVIRACDVDSLNILINCQLYNSSKLCSIIYGAFQEIIRKYQKGNKTFSAGEQIIIQRLVEYATNVNDHHSQDPIFSDTRSSSYRVLKLLLEVVANSGSCVPGKKQEDPIKVAAENGRIDLIQLLLKYSPLCELHYSYTECAIKNGHTDCARFLVKHSVKDNVEIAFTSAVNSQNPVYMKFLIENFQAEMKQFAHTKTMDNLLLSATKFGNVEIIGQLIDAGANVNCLSEYGRTPLMESKNAEVVYFLVQRGAVVNRYSRAKQRFSSALIPVLTHNYRHSEPHTKERIIEALLKSGAHVNVRSSGGNTLLMIAILKKESRNIVQLLLDYGADYNVTDRRGITLPLLAVKANKTDNILCLLQFSKYSKDILNFQTILQPPALMVAAKNYNLEVMKHLVDHGADVNVTDVSGYTALSFLLCQSPFDPKTFSCMKYLLDQGAVSHVSPDVPLKLILKRQIDLIPKLIQCGLGPSEVSPLNITHGMFTFYPGIVSVSPLCMALMTKNVRLARYFIENLFMTQSDTCRLIFSRALREYLQVTQSSDCLCILDELATQPMPLFTLAFVAVQLAVGSTPGREERINTLPLPRLVKDRLLFKREDVKLDVTFTPPPFLICLKPTFDCLFLAGMYTM